MLTLWLVTGILARQDGTEPPTEDVAPGISAMYSASPDAVERMYRLLFGEPKKKRKKKARLEKVALDLMREFDPRQDLPPLDLSAMRQAIALLDRPLENKRKTIEALLTKAIELTREEIDEDDDEILALFMLN
jgi:hypothetical protein